MTTNKRIEGQERASRNAVAPDLTTRRVVLKDEDQAAYLEHRIGIREDLRPLGVLESELANRIAAQTWRLARAPAIEVEIIDGMRFHATEGKASLAEIWEQGESTQCKSLERLSGYETALELSLMRLLADYRRAQDRRFKLEGAKAQVLKQESENVTGNGSGHRSGAFAGNGSGNGSGNSSGNSSRNGSGYHGEDS